MRFCMFIIAVNYSSITLNYSQFKLSDSDYYTPVYASDVKSELRSYWGER